MVLGLFVFAFSCLGYSWNYVGHKLVAQIAFDNLSPKAKVFCAQIFNIPSSNLDTYFVGSSIWLDEVRKQNNHLFDEWHFVDIAFTKDHTKLLAVKPKNILWALNQSIAALSENTTNAATKAFFLKVLIHTVGDIHQPLQTSTKLSTRYPRGDYGGNLYRLSHSSWGKNLHQYWDNGAGLLMSHQANYINKTAQRLEIKWGCSIANLNKTPEEWLDSTHYLSVTQVYSLRTHHKPSKHYQKKTRRLCEQQITYAGCRLAYILNQLAK
jgi:hypothetical protein